jgi:hypothetical protein
MRRESAVGALRRRIAAWAASSGDAMSIDFRRWRQLVVADPKVTVDVVRAAYVAVLEREPDPEGLAAHAEQLRRGLPLELLLAELARARDAEHGSGSHHITEEERITREELSSLRDLVRSQRATILALTRRLAALEDRLPADAEAAAPRPSTATGR